MNDAPNVTQIAGRINCARLNLNVVMLAGSVKVRECASIFVWNLFVCENTFPLFAIGQLAVMHSIKEQFFHCS
jgi:hypothetical protein